MADEADMNTIEEQDTVAYPSGRRRALKWTGWVLAVLLGIFALAFAVIDSDWGHRFAADQIDALEFDNGMRIGVEELDGSLFGRLDVKGLTLSDPKGEFLSVPEAQLDWRPLRYLFDHLDIRSLTSPEVRLLRLPEFAVTESDDSPLLPDLDIDIGTLKVDRFVAEAPVSGVERVLSLAGDTHIEAGCAQVNFNAETLAPDKGQGGDRLVLKLDAVPEESQLDMALSLYSPKDGVITTMAGFTEPLQAELTGKGDWARWDGEFQASLGSLSLANIGIEAREGRFGFNGEGRFSSLVANPVGQWLGPETAINLVADIDGSRVTLSGGFSSEVMRLDSLGLVDLGESRFEGLNLDLTILQPTPLAENLSADGLKGNITLNGSFAEPSVDYTVNAARVAINDMALQRLRASGSAKVDSDGYLVPIEARVARITGLDSVAGGALNNVRLGGTLAVQGARILSDDMRLRSPRIDARVTLLADVERGTYAGAIDGRLNDYRLESVGIFDIGTDMDLEADSKGGFALSGRVQARSTKLTNESVESFLGGETLVASNVRYGTDGVLTLSAIQLDAPLISIKDGRGTVGPKGELAFDLQAQSQNYGELTLAVAGTITEPQATLIAPSPGLGIGLADLNANVTTQDGKYRLQATGDTDYGALTADVTLESGERMTVLVNSADLGGIAFAGSLEQTPDGPFAGQLTAKGRGLGGVVGLSNEGEYQKADFNLRANNTRLDGAAGLTIGSAIVDGSVILYDQPRVLMDAQLAKLRMGGLSLTAARVQVDYKEGKGMAKVVAEGSQAYPFRLAGNARLEKDMWRATLKGRIRGVQVTTDGAMRIVPAEDEYQLLPSRLKLGNGTVTLSGRYGDGLMVQSKLEDLNIGLANAFVPDLGLGGIASGTLDFVQTSPQAFPRADARINIVDFTRTTAASVSTPVTIKFAGKLLADGGEARAAFIHNGDVVGRLQAGLRPLGPGAGDWVTRMMGSPLSGGVRYNGPAGTLFSLAGQADQQLSGAIGVAADFTGRLNDPQLEGVITGQNMVYENRTYGTRLTKLAIDGTFEGNRVIVKSLTGMAGDGTVEADGFVSLAADQGFPMDLDISLHQATLADKETLSGRATGELQLTKKAGETALLSGTLRLPESRYKFVRSTVEEVPKLTGVSFKPRKGRERITGEEEATAIPSLFDNLRMDINLTAPGRLSITGMGLESEWKADLRVFGTNAAPRMSGTVSVVRGTLGFAGRSFKLEEGTLTFTGGEVLDPTIEITASDEVEDVTVNVNVTGRAYDPQIAFTSTPSLPQDEIVSRILFGSSVANLSAVQAIQLAASLNTLSGSGGGFSVLGSLRSATGVDRLRILGEDDATGRGTALAAGKYITDDIYVEIITDARGFTATQLEISLTPALSILSQAGGTGSTDVSIQYKKNY